MEEGISDQAIATQKILKAGKVLFNGFFAHKAKREAKAHADKGREPGVIERPTSR